MNSYNVIIYNIYIYYRSTHTWSGNSRTHLVDSSVKDSWRHKRVTVFTCDGIAGTCCLRVFWIHAWHCNMVVLWSLMNQLFTNNAFLRPLRSIWKDFATMSKLRVYLLVLFAARAFRTWFPKTKHTVHNAHPSIQIGWTNMTWRMQIIEPTWPLSNRVRHS